MGQGQEGRVGGPWRKSQAPNSGVPGCQRGKRGFTGRERIRWLYLGPDAAAGAAARQTPC